MFFTGHSGRFSQLMMGLNQFLDIIDLIVFVSFYLKHYSGEMR